MWVHDMNKHTNKLSSLCYDSFCWTYRAAVGTWRWPTPASSPSSSPDGSTTRWNNTTIHCLLTRAPVMLPVLFWKFEKFYTLKRSEQPHKKGRVFGKKMLGAVLLFHAAADALSLLRTTEKRWWRSEIKMLCGHWPWTVWMWSIPPLSSRGLHLP